MRDLNQETRFTARLIKDVLKHGGVIDASDCIFSGDKGKIRVSSADGGAHRPPILQALRNVAGDPPDGGSTASQTQASTNVHSAPSAEDRIEQLRKFEALSLAARSRLMTAAWFEAGQPKPIRPTTQTPHMVNYERNILQALGYRMKRGAPRPAPGDRLQVGYMPTIDPEEILQAIAWAVDEVGPDQGQQGQSRTEQQLAMRAGLQLIGFRIAPRRRSSKAKTFDDGLRLANARLPFSLRLIGCVVECPILLSHCQLVTLDLSGSALNALDATGLIASGGVHLRRTLIRTPTSLAGAEIQGSLDASDLVVAPFARLPAPMPVDSDNGILNLSRMDVRTEVRLNRARVWGGLSLKGARIGRSLHISDALLVSPLAVFEKHEIERKKKSKPAVFADGAVASQLSAMDRELAADLRSLDSESYRPFSTVLEVLDGATSSWHSMPTSTLHQLRPRALIGAVRADGLHVDGTIFARRLVCNGMWRMKYATIQGAVRMDSCLFRSGEHVHRTLREAGSLREALDSSRLTPAALDRESHDVAIDLRESRIRGDLSFGWEMQDESPVSEFCRRTRAHRFQVFGRVRLTGLRCDGSLSFHRAEFEDRPVANSNLSGRSPWRFQDVYEALMRQSPSESKPRAGQRRVASKRSSIRNRFVQIMLGSTFRMVPTPAWKVRLAQARKRAPDLDLEQVTVERDVDLRDTQNLIGVCLQNSQIGGDLRMADKADDAPIGLVDSSQAGGDWVKCERRATNVRGLLNLRSSQVEGDAYLVFDPREGPHIDAASLRVEGQLEIYPQIGSTSFQLPPGSQQPSIAELADTDKFQVVSCKHERKENDLTERPPGTYCTVCHTMVDSPGDGLCWTIDLRNARSTIFVHPPAAWPDPGGLRIDGFHYSQSGDMGPLPPARPRHSSYSSQILSRSIAFSVRNSSTSKWILTGAVITVGVVLVSSASIFLYFTIKGLIDWSGVELSGLLSFTPVYGVLAIWTAFITALIFLTQIKAHLRPQSPFWASATSKRFLSFRPRAIEYLQRQRQADNRFKFRPTRSPILESYARAAKALRESGRYISANMVEEARLEVRTKMLSWRQHGVGKAFLLAVGTFCRYGFGLGRATFILASLILVIGTGAHIAAANGYLERVEVVGSPVPGRTSMVAGSSGGWSVLKANRCGSARPAHALNQDCPDVIYAADLLLPFISLGEDTRWRTAIPKPAALHLRSLWEPWQSLVVSFLRYWPALINALGLLLTAIMATAIAARVESALAKVEE